MSRVTALMAALIPSSALNTRRRMLAFPQKGVVFAADTRLSDHGGAMRGDWRKVGRVGDHILVGYSGSAVLCEVGLISFTEDNIRRPCRTHDDAAIRLGEHLRMSAQVAGAPNSRLGATLVLGTYFGAPALSRLSLMTGFKHERRQGPEFFGSGAAGLETEFLTHWDTVTNSWHQRAAGPQFEWDNERKVPIRIDSRGTVPWPVTLEDLAFACAVSVSELVLGSTDPTVGGHAQWLTLGPTGITTGRLMVSQDGGQRWIPGTADKLGVYSNTPRSSGGTADTSNAPRASG